MFDYKDFKKFANIVEAAEKLCGEDVVENYVDWAAFPFNFDGHEFREIEVSYSWNETKYVYVDNMPAEEYVKFFVLTEEMAEDLCMEIQSNLPSEPIEISYEDLEDMISSEESFNTSASPTCKCILVASELDIVTPLSEIASLKKSLFFSVTCYYLIWKW